MDQKEIIIGLVINLVSALIGFFGGRVYDRAMFHLRTRKARQFWKVFAKERTLIVIGRFREFEQFEPSGFLGVGDAIALAELESFYERLGLPKPPVAYADRLSGDQLKQNLILLGGPDANSVSEKVARRIEATLRFGEKAVHDIYVVDHSEGRVYSPSISSSSAAAGTDYGLVYKAKNPFSVDDAVLLIAGSFGYGTWAGVRYVTSDAFFHSPAVGKAVEFELLIETDVDLGVPQAIKQVAFRSLQPTSDQARQRAEKAQNPAPEADG